MWDHQDHQGDQEILDYQVQWEAKEEMEQGYNNKFELFECY